MVLVTRFDPHDRELAVIAITETLLDADNLITRDKEWQVAHQSAKYTKTEIGINRLTNIKTF